MSAKAGEVSRETAVYRCESCHHRVATRAGALIGECEKCGSSSFKASWSGSFARRSRSESDAVFEKA